MEPLAAFQVLVLTLAVAMAVEAFKATGFQRTVFWGLFTVSALTGVFTNQIAAVWPAASSLMANVGSSPAAIFLLAFGAMLLVKFLQRGKPSASAASAEARPQTATTQPAVASEIGELRGEFARLAEQVAELSETARVNDGVAIARNAELAARLEEIAAMQNDAMANST